MALFLAAAGTVRDPFAVSVQIVASRNACREEGANVLAVAGRRLGAKAIDDLRPIAGEVFLVDRQLLVANLLLDRPLFGECRRRMKFGRRRGGALSIE